MAAKHDHSAEREGTRRTVIRVLSMLERSRAPLSVRVMADACGVSKQTVDRILADLGGTYPIVEERDPDHAQRRLYRLHRGAAPASTGTLVVMLRVRRDGFDELCASPLVRIVAKVDTRGGDVRVRAVFGTKDDVFRAVLSLAPHVRIEAPRELDDELRRVVMDVWGE